MVFSVCMIFLQTSSLDDGVSGLRDDPDFLSKLLADCPQINPTVLSKLSPEVSL